jgi:hypothetical protein
MFGGKGRRCETGRFRFGAGNGDGNTTKIAATTEEFFDMKTRDEMLTES